MRLLVITSSPSDEIHLTLQNLTASGFKQTVIAAASHLGGAFQFTSLALALVQHLTCVNNKEYGGGCMAFIGGDLIFIEDST
jgi:hypothetical protein